MIYTTAKGRLVLLMLVWFMASGLANAADLKLPPVIKAGDLFVVTVAPDIASERQINFKFDAAQLQFMGALQGTPDIQIRGDGEIEIKPDAGNLASLYELKFLASIASGKSSLVMRDKAGERSFDVMITVPEAERGYSWLILLAGIVLLVAGVKMWRYQKNSPAMMSTKSLFMNYEELEKARKMYFPDETPGSITPPVAEAEAVPVTSPAKSSAGSATAKSPAIGNSQMEQPKPVASAAVQNKTQKTPSYSINPQQKSADGMQKNQPSTSHTQQSDEHLRNRLAALFDDEDDTPAPVPVKKPAPVVDAAPVDSSAPAVRELSPDLPASQKELPVQMPSLKERLDEALRPAEKDEDKHEDKPAEKQKSAEIVVPVEVVKPVEAPVIVAPPVVAPKTAPMQQPVFKHAPVETALPRPGAAAAVMPPEVTVVEKLIFALEDGSGRHYEATGTVVKIGRRKENQICITASEISREHAEVTISKGTVYVRSLTESNTTRLNNRPVKENAPIKPGDTLNLGGTNFVVQKARPA